MNHDPLRSTLEALRMESTQLAASDTDARARIESLMAAMEVELANPDAASLTDGFGDTIQDLVTRYEVEHPRLTGVLGQLLRALGDMGI